MTRPKDNRDLIDAIRTDQLPPAPTVGTPPGRDHDAERWAGIVSALQTAEPDLDEIGQLLIELALPRELGELFVLIVQTDRELAAVITAGDGAAEQEVALARRIRVLRNSHAVNLADVDAIDAELTRCEKALPTIAARASAAAMAASNRAGLHCFAPEVFGEGQSKPSHCGLPANVNNLCVKMGIDPYKAGSWKTFRRPEARPARRPRLVATK